MIDEFGTPNDQKPKCFKRSYNIVYRAEISNQKNVIVKGKQVKEGDEGIKQQEKEER